jgi:hypothetical protein
VGFQVRLEGYERLILKEKVEETQAFRGFKILVCENIEKCGGVEIGEEGVWS